MFYKYRLHELDGSDAGEAHYAFLVKPGEEILTGAGRKLRVIDVIPVEEPESPPRDTDNRSPPWARIRNTTSRADHGSPF